MNPTQQKCLQKDPQHRFQSPDQVLTALMNVSSAGAWTWEAAECWWRENLPESIARVHAKVAETPQKHRDSLEDTVIEGHSGLQFEN